MEPTTAMEFTTTMEETTAMEDATTMAPTTQEPYTGTSEIITSSTVVVSTTVVPAGSSDSKGFLDTLYGKLAVGGAGLAVIGAATLITALAYRFCKSRAPTAP